MAKLHTRMEHLMFKRYSFGAASSGLLTLALLVSAGHAYAQPVAPQSTATNQQLLDSFSSSPTRATFQGGETIYRSMCQGCHMPNGEGAHSGAGFFPDLRKNQKLGAGAYPAMVVVNGLHGMPPFGAWMDDQQVADVVNYIRTHFNNDYKDTVRPDDVKQFRGAR
ncbi:fructose dehydrogenase cytochrome subunit precursor [Variovorax paradoxus]|jgi:mono/diheme cytochrome c family protein|uniref:Fructose dehydrogenase cytochrome subunit n=2 Tax=Variovorax paradoxus TaxID=34073 RepID=A0A0H2LZ64_VARPD|nr:fructose dehydrogenase cytochrome subunit precursor [Variovorax paradoxus]